MLFDAHPSMIALPYSQHAARLQCLPCSSCANVYGRSGTSPEGNKSHLAIDYVLLLLLLCPLDPKLSQEYLNVLFLKERGMQWTQQ